MALTKGQPMAVQICSRQICHSLAAYLQLQVVLVYIDGDELTCCLSVTLSDLGISFLLYSQDDVSFFIQLIQFIQKLSSTDTSSPSSPHLYMSCNWSDQYFCCFNQLLLLDC
ncbi:hypothetical protein D9U64_04880 [Vibrio cholerae]|nr:hypothetical protein [Vibrio cholerae]EGR1305586.1 hypothetical protein [Vibrio cholerae]